MLEHVALQGESAVAAETSMAPRVGVLALGRQASRWNWLK
jgi:hypothetical protein